MKGEIRHADGRVINLAGAIDPVTYVELEHTRSPRLNPALRCGGCNGGVYIRHGSVHKDILYFAHHDTGDCKETLTAHKSAPMSDEHKREQEYHARAAIQAGHVADLEVRTTRGTQVDVVVDGRIGFEIQHSGLKKAAAVDRTARSVKSGLATVAWFSDKTTSPVWAGHVPGYRTIVPLSAWQALPLPGTVGAAGLQTVEAARCGSRKPCLHRKPCNRYVPSVVAWNGLKVDAVVTGLSEGTIRPVRLNKFVRLVSAGSAALYEELTGQALAYDAGQPKGRSLTPAVADECDRPSVQPLITESTLGPWRWCPHCSRRHRQISPASLCYDCAAITRRTP